MSAPDRQLLYVLDLRARNLSVEVRVNDIVVSGVRGGAPVTEQTVLNAFIVPGNNTITMRGVPAGKGVPSLRYRVFRTFRAADAEEETLVSREMPEPGALASAGVPVFAATNDFLVAQAFGTWAWQSRTTRPFDLERDPPLILQLVQRVWTALAARDEQTMMALMQLKTEELARALQLTPASLDDDAREHYRYLFDAPEWHLRPLAPADLTFSPMANGAIVSVGRRSGRPPVESDAGPGFKLTMMASNVTTSSGAPEWRIVR